MRNLTKLLLVLSIFTGIAHASETNDDFIIKSSKALKLNNSSNTHSVSIKSPDTLTGSVIFTLPNSAGANGQAIVTDGTGNLSWGSATSVIDTLTSTVTTAALSANMGKTLEDKKANKAELIYGINPDPYPNPSTLEEAKEQAKAQVEKKRIDAIEKKYDAIKRNKDIVKLSKLLLKTTNGGTLTTEEKKELNDIKNRMNWYNGLLSEADTYRSNIDSAGSIADAIAVSDGATFSSEWYYIDSFAIVQSVVDDTTTTKSATAISVLANANTATISITGVFSGSVSTVTFGGVAVTIDSQSTSTITVSNFPELSKGTVLAAIKESSGDVTQDVEVFDCDVCRLVNSCPF